MHTATRDKRIVDLYVEQGMSLAEIGKRYNVSRERVRQILNRDLGPDKLREIKSQRKTEDGSIDIDKAVTTLRSTLRKTNGVSLKTLQDQTGLTPEQISAAKVQLKPEEQIKIVSGSAPRQAWTQDEITTVLNRAWRECGGSSDKNFQLTASQYEEWRQKKASTRKHAPGAQAIARFYDGRWSNALDAVGLPSIPDSDRRRGRKRNWTEEKIVASLYLYLQDLLSQGRSDPTSTDYAVWAEKHNAPSVALITLRYGWQRALLMALNVDGRTARAIVRREKLAS